MRSHVALLRVSAYESMVGDESQELRRYTSDTAHGLIDLYANTVVLIRNARRRIRDDH